MTEAAVLTELKAYARRVREARKANPAVSEPGLAPQFQRLVEALLPLLPAAPQLTVSPEYTNPGVGRPDIALKRPGQVAAAFIELKAADKPVDGAAWKTPHDKRQFERFRELPHWAVSNFHQFRLYERGDAMGDAVVAPTKALAADTTDAVADKLMAAHDAQPFLALLQRLAQSQPPTPKTAEEFAALLAHAARLVRGIVRDRLAELGEADAAGSPLLQVRQEFRDVLYQHPEAGGYASADFDKLFSAAFAQVLAFGLLLVRESTGKDVDAHAADHMPVEHPLMKTTLQVLSQPAIAAEIGAGFDLMLDTVNRGLSNPKILAVKNGRDPILYFYEDFLQVFDKADRERYGVFYTPVEVVRFMTAALDRALRERLGTDGLTDPGVHILDPATGTGTFLLGVAERVRERVIEEHGPGQAPLALQGLAKRMYGFELLVGPYAVAHYRLHHALSRTAEGEEPPSPLPRLGVYLADTLARPDQKAATSGFGFYGAAIAAERNEAERIRSKQEVLAIIGNPPYRRLLEGEDESLVGRWMNDEVWDDLKAPVRDAGQGGQLNTFPELSVAFWRWAIWKLFEADNAPQRGVVAFITNRKFLTGWPYAGLRKMLRERFDRIEVVDLRGDLRRGERAGLESDGGVFNIQVGVAITLAIADGSKAKGTLAEVTYNDAWAHAHLSRKAKLGWLGAGAKTGELNGGVEVGRDALEDMRPTPFYNGQLMSLREAFRFAKSGMKSGDDPSFVSVNREALIITVTPHILVRTDPTYLPKLEQPISYRPLDKRWFFNDRALLNRPGPELQRVWGESNVGLYAMPSGTSGGPAVWCHGLLPDYHAFRGNYGGYAFPLYDRRPVKASSNVRGELVAALTAAYGGDGGAVTPEAVFDVILCLLSASTYTTRFAEDLEDVFPHVPFPAEREVFDRAAALGAEIRAVETFARPPGVAFTKGAARVITAPKGKLAGALEPKEGVLVLCADGSGKVGPVPPAVWRFAVSGYRVLPRWLAAREGVEVDESFTKALRDIVGRIGELVDLFAKADAILEATLAEPLSRAALGLAAEEEA